MTGRWYRRLGVQLGALLTLALLPLGAIAVYQTTRVAEQVDETAGLALLGLTERAARQEQVLIERAVGAARLFGSLAPELVQSEEGCAPILSQYIRSHPNFSFIGVLPQSGIVECSSRSDVVDLSGAPNLAQRMENQQPTIIVNRDGPVSGRSVFVVSEPFEVNGEFAGFVSVSIPHGGLRGTDDWFQELGLVDLVTFNSAGEVLTARSGLDAVEQNLPADVALINLAADLPLNFKAMSESGVERRYSVVAIENSPASVLAVWDLGEGPTGLSNLASAPAFFPILMWIASMAVALLAVDSLVIRHLRRLRRNMDRFANDRSVAVQRSNFALLPDEIEHLEDNFEAMSRDVVQDEATVEDALREKSVLVKEIHHRVKNNLQLIASIMNMQIRTAENHETRTVLRRLQDRVLSLATIHRDLYQSEGGGRVDAGVLLQEIVTKAADMVSLDGGTVEVNTDIDPVLLYPDQAVPLSLLTAEATTNAVKHLGDGKDPNAWLGVSLKQTGDGCVLRVSNSLGQAAAGESTGLGTKLMKAFALQLGGTVEAEATESRYTLTLRFQPSEFQPEARDF